MKPRGKEQSRSPPRNRRQQHQHMMRLDVLTIAGLTGAARSSSGVGAGVAVGTGASASRGGESRSPARSDATLSSIEDSFKGGSSILSDGSSILSDELGEIVFTDDELDIREDDDDIGGGVAAPNNGDSSSSSSSEALEGGQLRPRGHLGIGEIYGVQGREGEEIWRKEGRTAVAVVTTAPAGPAAPAAVAVGENVCVSKSLEPNGFLSSPTAAAAARGAHQSALKDSSVSAGQNANGLPTSSNHSSSGDMLPTPEPSFRPPCATVPTTAATAASTSPIPSPRVSPPLVTPPPASTASSPVGQPQQQQVAAAGAAAVAMAPELEHHRRTIGGSGGASRATTPSLAEQSTPTTSTTARRRQTGDGATLPKVNTSSRDRSQSSGTAFSGVGASATCYGGGGSAGGVVSQRPRAVPTTTCKVLVVGNAKCGKSSIISRFVNGRFSSDYNSTVGADYAMRDVHLRDGRQVRLQLWDIAGQDRFAKLTRAYFRRAKGAIVVCDVTREGTFDAIVRWKEEIELWSQNEGCELPVYLFANKCDLLTKVQDSFLAGARMEKTCRESSFAGWYITSAKRGDNIDEAMTKLLEDVMEMEGRRNRGTEAGQPGGSGGNSSREAKGKAFELSSGGLREGGQGMIGQSCCA